MTGSSLHTALRRGAIRFYEDGLHRRSIFRRWRALERSQWYPLEQLQSLQLDRLQQFLLQVNAESPWYRDFWRVGGLDPREMRTFADFARWPVIDKAIIRAHRDAMRSTNSDRRLISKTTGGSSGIPLQFDLDHESYQARFAAWHRGYHWAGAAPGTRQWYLWGSAPTTSTRRALRKAAWYDRLYRHTMVSCFDLSEATFDRVVASLGRTRPEAIVSYTNAIYTFARMLEARRVIPYSPHSIVVGAEKLHGYQRETIERVFRAPVFETYGCREFMLIGAECGQHAGLHLTTENLVVELVDDDGRPVPPGVEGNVVITDLTNLGMPFVRYANGDRAIAAKQSCACGRGLPMLTTVTGRRLDILTTPDGRSLPGEFFPHILKDIPSIEQFQVIQERPEAVRLKLIAPQWTDDDALRVRREVAAVAGAALSLEIQLVDDIPLTSAGKLRVVVNLVDSAPGGGGAR